MVLALAGQHVEHRLGADDLRGRVTRGKPRSSRTFRDLGEHFVDAAQRALLLQLVGQVGHHAARHLVDLHAGIHGGELAFELVVLLAHGMRKYMPISWISLEVQAGVERRAAQGGDHRLGARVAGARRSWRWRCRCGRRRPRWP